MKNIFAVFLSLALLVAGFVMPLQMLQARIPEGSSMGYHKGTCDQDGNCVEDDKNSSSFSNYSPKNLYKKIKKELLELDLHLNVDLLDVDLLDGISVAIQNRYESEPSYHNGYYTRIDKWDVKEKINVGEILETVFGDLPFGATIQPGNSVIFVRQYKDQLKARTALPVNPLKIPLNAKLARELEEGTFVSIPTYLNLLTRIGPDVANTSFIEASTGYTYLVSGEFITQIFKLSDNRIRLKAIYNTRKGPGLYFKICLDSQIDIASSLTNNLINDVLDFELFETNYDDQKGHMLAFDYFLDLSYPEVQRAYDAFMKSSLKFAPKKAKLIFRDQEKMVTSAISNLEPIHKIFMDDKDKPQEDRRVDKLFESSNNYNKKTFKISLDVKLFEFKTNNIKSSNYIIHTDRDEIKSFYQFDTFSKKSEFNLFFSIFDSKTIKDSYALYRADQNRNLTELDNSDFGISFEKTDEFLSRNEQIQIKNYLFSSLPESIYEKIEWNKIISPSKDYIKQHRSTERQNSFYTTATQRDGKVHWQIHFHKNIFGILDNSNDQELSNRLAVYIKEYIGTGPSTQTRLESLFPSSVLALHNTINDTDSDHGLQLIDLEFYKKRLIKLIRQYVNEQGDSKKSKKAKNQYLAKIQRNEIFEKIGIAFLTSFINEEDLENYVTFNLLWTSDEVAKNLGENYTYTFGTTENCELYKNLIYQKGILENRSFDLRLVGYDITKVPNYKHWLDIYDNESPK